MIKVYYDFQALLYQKYGGISRYYFELIKSLDLFDGVETRIECIGSINKYFETRFNKKAHELGNSAFQNGIYFLFCAGINVFKSLFTKCKYDIIHSTYYSPYVLIGKKKNQKIVITVYDMIHELFPEVIKGETTIKYKKKMIYSADHIIAISENTKRDILKIYPDIAPEKISVIYIGSNFEKKEDIENVPQLLPNYILFVGNRGGYKNFLVFWNAVKMLFEEDESLNLVCLGGGAFSEEEKKEIDIYSDRVQQINANDDFLSYAYTHARCFVFPSLYEGFGIPTLEAFACDCPVLLSNTSSFPEVGGDAVEYFDPYSSEDIKEKMKLVVWNEEKRKMMIEKGRKQLEKFRWNTIAQQVMECYRKILLEG